MDDLSSRVQELPGKVMTSVSGVAEKCSLQWCRLTRPLFTAATRVQGRPIYVSQPRLFQTSGRNRVFSAEWSVPSLDISLLPFEYCDEHVFLSVCLLVYPRNQITKSSSNCGARYLCPSSFLLWRGWDILHISSFADDVMYAQNRLGTGDTSKASTRNDLPGAAQIWHVDQIRPWG